MSSSPSPTTPPAASPRHFTDLLRHGRYRFTERKLMQHPDMSYRIIR
ncbi:hypothetical protein [Hymenobacter amundsenii]|nr:hypothetical protein [Hymenobacter amundsenii]